MIGVPFVKAVHSLEVPLRKLASFPDCTSSELYSSMAARGVSPISVPSIASEWDIRTILDAVPHNIYLASAEGMLLHVNRVALDYYGLPLDDFVSGVAFQKAAYLEDYERAMAERIAGFSAAVMFEYEARGRRHDGEYRWFLYRVNPMRDPQGRIAGWCATGTDIHDRKTAEERVRKEVTALREEIDRSSLFDEIVGRSAAMQKVFELIQRVAATDADVLILGEPDRDQLYAALSAAEKRLGRPVQATIRDRAWLGSGTGAFHDTVTSRPLLELALAPD